MDDRVDRLADEWDPPYRESFEYTSNLIEEFHTGDLETISPIVSKCYPAMFETVADAVKGAPDPGPAHADGAPIDGLEMATEDRATSIVDTGANDAGVNSGPNTVAKPNRRNEVAADGGEQNNLQQALDILDSGDQESRRDAAWTLLDVARQDPGRLDRPAVYGPILDHRHNEAVRPLLHGVLHQIDASKADSSGDPPDRTAALTSDDDERRRVAAAAFARTSSRYSERESEVDALIDLLTEHTASVGARSQAARALSYRDDYSDYRPRPTGIAPSLIEIAGQGDVDGRGAAAKLLTETAFHDPEAFDDDTFDAIVETVSDAIGDEDYRVRLRAISPLCEYSAYEDVLGDRVTTIGEAVASARDDTHPVVANRARTAWNELPVDESDISDDAASAGGPRPDASLKERVKALDTEDTDELAANWSLILQGIEDDDANIYAASRAKALALADPEPILDDEGAISRLADHLVSGKLSEGDAAVALGAAVVADPTVADRETALRVIGQLGYYGSYSRESLPGLGWTLLGVAAGAKSADGDDDSVRRVQTYVTHLDVDPIEFLVALWNEDRDAITTVAHDVRDRIGKAEGVATRAVIELADINPELWGDALPAAIRELEHCDEEERVESLATVRSVAETDPERVAPATDELLDLVLDPHPETREQAAWICWHVGRDDTSQDLAPAVAALASYEEDVAKRQLLWPAGAIARDEPKLVETGVLQAVEDRLDERSNRTDGEHLGSLIAEVHAGDPDVGRPAVDRLLETIDNDNHPELSSGTSIRADVSAILAAVADRYAETIVEAVEGIAAYAQSANWSSERGMQNAVLTLDALVEENYDDSVYAALRMQIPRGEKSERGSHDSYVRRHGYFADESVRIADLYLDAVLAERAADRERLETGSRGLLNHVSVDTLDELSDEEIRTLIPEIAGRLEGESDDGDGKVEAVAESRPGAVAAHVEVVGDLLDEYWAGPRTVGASVARTLASHDPDTIRPIAKQLAGRVADEEDEYVLRASADALRRLASEEPDLVAAALTDRFDYYDTDAEAPAEVLARCDEFEQEDTSKSGRIAGLLSGSGSDRPSTRQIVVECFETAGIDPERTTD